MPNSTFRVVITALAALVLLRPGAEFLQIVSGDALSLADTFTVVVTLQLLNAVLGGVIASALAWRAAEIPAARALAVLAVLWPACIGGIVSFDHPVLGRLAIIFQFSAAIFAIAAFLRFSAVFTSITRPPLERNAGPIGSLIGTLRRGALDGKTVWLGPAAILLAALSSVALPAGPVRVWFEMTVGVLAAIYVPSALYAGGLNLKAAYAAASASERRRLFWLGESMLIFAIGFFLLPFLLTPVLLAFDLLTAPQPSELSWFHPLLQGVTMAIALLCLALAMFYDGAVDPRTVVRKTTLYGLLTLAGIFVFAVVENAIAGLFTGVVSQWVSAGIAALCVLPAHNWLRSRIERLTRDSPAAGVNSMTKAPLELSGGA